MDKAKVALIRCDTYEDNQVFDAIHKGLNLLGGINTFVESGEKIVLKPNILIGTDPCEGVTTHPAVFRAIGNILRGAGIEVYYGDSPVFGKSEVNLRKAGLKQIGNELGLKLADFDSGRSVSHKNALLIKKFIIAKGVLDNDGLISLPRFKIHGFVRFTGAVKNQFGCIPGLLKSQYHVKLPDPHDFATMLIDLNTLIRPRLYIMDGIIAMEGNGPRSGNLKHLNVILLSNDPIALDATACRIINLDPQIIPTSSPGAKADLGTYHIDNIELVGESIESFFDPDFKVNRTPVVTNSSSKLKTFIKNIITERPVINFRKCSLCGTCITMCPIAPKAIDWNNGDNSKPPKFNYNLCIRCYCCQETCPSGAIRIDRSLLSRFFLSF